MKKNKLPKTDSIEELARFWDTHDLTDFQDELEEVTEPVFQSDEAIRVHLQPRESKEMRKLAKSNGVSQSELVHRWVREKLHRPLSRKHAKR